MPLHLRATTTSSSTTVTSSTAPEIPGMRLTSPSAAIVSPQSAICAKPMPNAKSTPRAHCGPPGFIEMLGQSIAQCLAESEKLETPDVNTADFSYMRKRKQEYSSKVRKALKRKVLNLAQKREVFVYFKREETREGALHAEELL